MQPYLFRLTPLLLLALLVTGCKTLDEKKSSMELQEILSSYQTTIRWDRLEQAYLFLKPGAVEPATPPPGLDNIRVTGYEVVIPPTTLSEHTISQTAIISFVLQDRQVERSLTDQQVWEYDQQQKLWFRINPIPEFR